MGLDSDATAALRTKYASQAWLHASFTAPTASAGDTLTVAAASAKRGVVVIGDYLTRFMTIPRDVEWTLARLFRFFFDRIAQVLFDTSNTVEAYIVVCDDRKYATSAKRRTQAKRTETSRKSDAKKGIAPPEPYTDAPDAHSIDLRRLGKWDKRGTWLWEAFVPLAAQAMKDKCPAGRVLFLDFDRDTGPVRINHEGAVTSMGKPLHMIGEADPACLWWVAHWAPKRRDLDYHIESNDSDIFAIYLLHHDACVRRCQRVCQHTDIKAGVMVDLSRMAEQLRVTTQLPNLALVAAWLVACGTDFVDRTRVAYGITAEPLLVAFRSQARYVNCFGTAEEMLRAVLRDAWFVQLSTSMQVPERFRKELPAPLSFDELRKRSKRVPSEDVLDEECARFAWNLDYWANVHTGEEPCIDE
ncbi:MAG: hypothetical protein Q7V62_05755, partial [Actinomycetota bacterium]|nr:hypothetical protein [Actinomycetota bacterium]